MAVHATTLEPVTMPVPLRSVLHDHDNPVPVTIVRSQSSKNFDHQHILSRLPDCRPQPLETHWTTTPFVHLSERLPGQQILDTESPHLAFCFSIHKSLSGQAAISMLLFCIDGHWAVQLNKGTAV